jgi:hypothetical protein
VAIGRAGFSARACGRKSITPADTKPRLYYPVATRIAAVIFRRAVIFGLVAGET